MQDDVCRSDAAPADSPVGSLSRRAVLAGMIGASALLLPARPAVATEGRIRQAILYQITLRRADHGLKALPEDPRLAQVATAWSGRMAHHVGLAHNPDRNAQFGWPISAEGEICGFVGGSSTDAEGVARLLVDNWMNSPRHRDIILGAGWTDVGVGWAADGAGRTYATGNFVTAATSSGTSAALELSQTHLPAASAARVVICRSDLFVDSLAGSGLLDGGSPMLFARPDRMLDHPVLREITRVAAPGATVYLVGGALPAAVDSQVTGLGFAVKRLAGSSRYETAALVAEEVSAVRGAPDRLLLACADQWADAVAVGGQMALHGTPVLLVDRDQVPQETSQILARFPNAERVVIGGSGVVGDQVLAEVGGRRIAGADRADTGVQVMRDLWARSTGRAGEHLILTPGWTSGGWQTALAHSTYAARFHAPLLFLADQIPDVVRDALIGLGHTATDSPTLLFDRTVPEPVRAAVRGLTGQQR